MDYWEITKRGEDGTRYIIRIRMHRKKLVIDEVGVIPKGKRLTRWLTHAIRDSYSWRRLNSEDRAKAIQDMFKEKVPNGMMEQALTEAWKSIKPSGLSF